VNAPPATAPFTAKAANWCEQSSDYFYDWSEKEVDHGNSIETVVSSSDPLAEAAIKMHQNRFQIMREVVLHKPNSSVRNTPFALVAGTRQSLPPDGVQLLDVVRNLPARGVRIVAREILDAQLPDWHNEVPSLASQLKPWHNPH
jgi:hypothetical protein